ncbi:hypothetical protein ILYODFUR_021006 [Ilyodon furcidens]|uniref:Uncharacterized protein n=1 Tax=Ilyodon furcidens TaxID=33524 RepID=A0ABV0TP28_9TELE
MTARTIPYCSETEEAEQEVNEVVIYSSMEISGPCSFKYRPCSDTQGSLAETTDQGCKILGKNVHKILLLNIATTISEVINSTLSSNLSYVIIFLSLSLSFGISGTKIYI